MCVVPCCCPGYKAKESEGVFEFRGWCSGSAFMGMIVTVAAIVTTIILSSVPDTSPTGGDVRPVKIYLPLGFFIFAALLFLIAGGEWLVINVNEDKIFLVKGHCFHLFTRRQEVGPLSKVVNMSMKYALIAHHHQITPTVTGICFEFSYGVSETVCQMTYRNRTEIAREIQMWLDTHYSGHKIQFGHDDHPSVHIDALIVTQNTPLLANNSEIEQELRTLIVRYQMGTNNDSQSDGRKLALAMEYNPNSLLSTYSVLKQQNPVLNKQAEKVLINTAQTIIDAKNGVAPAAVSDALSEEEGFN